MTHKHISLAPVPDSNSVRANDREARRRAGYARHLVALQRAAFARAEARRTLERTEIQRLWAEGFDTKDISSRVNHPESFVYNTLSKLREQVRELT